VNVQPPPYAVVRHALADAIMLNSDSDDPAVLALRERYRDSLLMLDLGLMHVIGPEGWTRLNPDGTVSLTLDDAVMITRALDDAISHRMRLRCRRSSENEPLRATYRMLAAALWRVWS
jgi:hypothetical protein